MSIHRPVELHCDGDDGRCSASPDISRGITSVRELRRLAKLAGWVRRKAPARLPGLQHVIDLCPDCAAHWKKP